MSATSVPPTRQRSLGVVIAYERNVTNTKPRRAGIEGITVPSCDLAPGRGGPRCMSRSFARDVA